MITGIETETEDGRRARVYFSRLPTSQDAASIAVADHFWDDESDLERETLLRRVLGEKNVRALAFPTYGLPGTIQLFLLDNATRRRVFACVLVTGSRLRDLLEQRSPLVEGFSLQVMPGERLSMQGIRAGAQAWIERFPALMIPDMTVHHWMTPTGISRDLLRILLSEHRRRLAADGDTSNGLVPADIVDPPYEVAA